MRTKAQILEAKSRAIINGRKKDHEMFEQEYLTLEVWIDIRDLLQGVFNRLADLCEFLQNKH